jgi:hypothetical protein
MLRKLGDNGMSKKKLSNPFSTGGGGVHFENCVQAAFVTLMITGGYTPCFPSKPIVEVNLQGKIDGYATDDLIVTTATPEGKETQKMLVQIKHSIAFTKSEESVHLNIFSTRVWNLRNTESSVSACQSFKVRSTLSVFCDTTFVRRVKRPR